MGRNWARVRVYDTGPMEGLPTGRSRVKGLVGHQLEKFLSFGPFWNDLERFVSMEFWFKF